MIQFTCPACGHIEKLGPAAAVPTSSGAADPQNHVAAAQQVFGADVAPPKCPTHGFELKRNSRGYYCSGKTNGKWCDYRVAG
jgi:hypothetical protein